MSLTGNPDYISWRQFFFDNSGGTMRIRFDEELKSFIEERDSQKV